MFDTEELRDKLKTRRLARPGAARHLHVLPRRDADRRVRRWRSFYLFVIADFGYPPLDQARLIALGAGYRRLLRAEHLHREPGRRSASSRSSSAFPDALDMLLICVESGMSVEAAFGKVVEGNRQPVARAGRGTDADHRRAVLSAGPPPGLTRISASAPASPGVKAVTTALIQAERYGTPVGQALRVMAKENRDMRMSEAEKKAAALPPKLTVPMIVFFLPVLFVVILGPAMIQVFGYR